MNILRKIWHNLLVNKTLTFITVLCTGVLSYALIFLSFTSFRIPFINLEIPLTSLPQNEALNHYATAVSGLVGTAATVIGVTFLIYAYRDQQEQADERRKQVAERLEQDKRQQVQDQLQLYNNLYKDLLDDINSIQYRKKYKATPASSNDTQLFQGVDALFNYEAAENKTDNSVLNHLNLILFSFDSIVKTLISSGLKPEEKELFLKKIYLLYLAKIYWPCDKISNRYRNRIISKRWGYPKMLFYHLDMMTKSSYHFLIKRNLVVVDQEGNDIDDILKLPPEKLKERYYEKFEFLGENLFAIMTCDYTSIESYCKKPPAIVDKPKNPDATIPKIIKKIFGDTDFADAIVNKANQGSIAEARDYIYWLRHAFKKRTNQKK